MRRSRRAIMLISVLLLTLMVLMFVGSAISLAPASVGRSQADVALSSARAACQSGLEWARTRISADPRWNASAAASLQGPGVWVEEGDGQVVGWVQENRRWSRFRLRFNFQDGPASSVANSDNLPNPAQPWSDFLTLAATICWEARTAPCPAPGTRANGYTTGPGPTCS